MKKLLAALAAVLVGVGVVVFFGLPADRGGGDTAREALAVGLYGEDMSESWTCDDIREIVNPSALSGLPPVVAVIEAEDIQFSIEILNRNVASLMVAGATSGRPYADEKQALREIEDSIILYIALAREGRGVSEDEAQAILEKGMDFACGMAPQGVSEAQMVRAIQMDRTTTRFVQQMIIDGSAGPQTVDQAIADLIAQARPTVKITEVALAATGGRLECTQADVKVACPSGLPTSEPTPTPAKP
jgi:hypothetical protein